MVAFARPRVESRRPLAVVRLQGAGRTWEVLGSDSARGLVAEGLALTADTHGPQTCGFRVKRDPTVLHPDLGPFAACDVEIGGVPVWAGRVWELPGARGEERSMSVSGRGWQSHLEDVILHRVYVHQRLSDWRDGRSFINADLTERVQGYGVVAGDGAIVMSVPQGTTVGTGTMCSVVLDTGPDNGTDFAGKRIVATYTSGGHPDFELRARNGAAPTSNDEQAVVDVKPIETGPNTFAHTFTTNRRYVEICFRNDKGTPATPGDETAWVRFTSIKVFRQTDIESGNESILKASRVIEDCRNRTSQLSLSNEAIQTSTFSIPHMETDGYQSARSVADAANAYQDWLWGVDANRRMFFRPRPTAPLYEVGAWSGSSFDDQSTGSAENLYNRVIVEGQGPAGETIHVIRTKTSPLLDRHGLTRTRVLQVGAVLTTASAEAIGDAWLAEHARSQMRGTLRIVGMGGVRTTQGRPVHPAELLLAPGQRMRFMQMVDPDAGGMGRDGTIASVSYDHDSETASIEIDNERGRFDALLARLGAIQEVSLS